MDLNIFRPTTLATMAADLYVEYAENGDPRHEMQYMDVLVQLSALLGDFDAERMIEDALAEMSP